MFPGDRDTEKSIDREREREIEKCRAPRKIKKLRSEYTEETQKSRDRGNSRELSVRNTPERRGGALRYGDQ